MIWVLLATKKNKNPSLKCLSACSYMWFEISPWKAVYNHPVLLCMCWRVFWNLLCIACHKLKLETVRKPSDTSEDSSTKGMCTCIKPDGHFPSLALNTREMEEFQFHWNNKKEEEEKQIVSTTKNTWAWVTSWKQLRERHMQVLIGSKFRCFCCACADVVTRFGSPNTPKKASFYWC